MPVFMEVLIYGLAMEKVKALTGLEQPEDQLGLFDSIWVDTNPVDLIKSWGKNLAAVAVSTAVEITRNSQTQSKPKNFISSFPLIHLH
jgi:hypothetical protein